MWWSTAGSRRPPGGFYLGPTLVDDVKPGTPVYDDEIFGPVLSVVRVATYDEALALVNANPYANGVAIFTRDGGAARRFESDVQVGMVGVNVPIPVPVSYYSFGGWKASLFGDIHMYGPDGIRFFTRTKVVTSRWPDPASSSVDLGFPRKQVAGPACPPGTLSWAPLRARTARCARPPHRPRTRRPSGTEPSPAWFITCPNRPM